MTSPSTPATHANSNETLLLQDLRNFEKLRRSQLGQLFLPKQEQAFFVKTLSQLLVAEDVQQAKAHLNALEKFFSNNIHISLEDSKTTTSTPQTGARYKVVNITVGERVRYIFQHNKPDLPVDMIEHSSVIDCLWQKLTSLRTPVLKGNKKHTSITASHSLNNTNKKNEDEASAIAPVRIRASESMTLFRLLLNSPKNTINSYSQFEKEFEDVMLTPGDEQAVASMFESSLPQDSSQQDSVPAIESSVSNFLHLLDYNYSSDELITKVSDHVQAFLAAQKARYPKPEYLQKESVLPCTTDNPQLSSTWGKPVSSAVDKQDNQTEISANLFKGLHNFGNTCAFNASLQATSRALLPILEDKTKGLERQKTSIFNMLFQLPFKVFGSTGGEPIEIRLSEEQAGTMASAITVNNNYKFKLPTDLGVGVLDITNKCEALNALISSLIKVCNRVNTGNCSQQDLIEFYDAYGKHAVNAKRSTSRQLLNIKRANNKPFYNLSRIQQVCADEIITDFMTITGLSTASDCTLCQYGLLRAYNAEQCVHTTIIENPPIGVISLPVAGNSFDISNYLKQYTAEEDASDWEFDHEEHSLSKPTKKTRQTELKAQDNLAPKYLVLSLKLFDNKAKKKTVTPSVFKVFNGELCPSNDVGVLSLCELSENNFRVKVPISDMEKTKVVTYQVIAVICHIGSNAISGHYITVRLSDDAKQITICDDMDVLSLMDYKKDPSVKQKYKVEEQDPFSAVCIKCGFSGYVYFLKRLNEPDDMPVNAENA